MRNTLSLIGLELVVGGSTVISSSVIFIYNCHPTITQVQQRRMKEASNLNPSSNDDSLSTTNTTTSKDFILKPPRMKSVDRYHPIHDDIERMKNTTDKEGHWYCSVIHHCCYSKRYFRHHLCYHLCYRHCHRQRYNQQAKITNDTNKRKRQRSQTINCSVDCSNGSNVSNDDQDRGQCSRSCNDQQRPRHFPSLLWPLPLPSLSLPLPKRRRRRCSSASSGTSNASYYVTKNPIVKVLFFLTVLSSFILQVPTAFAINTSHNNNNNNNNDRNNQDNIIKNGISKNDNGNDSNSNSNSIDKNNGLDHKVASVSVVPSTTSISTSASKQHQHIQRKTIKKSALQNNSNNNNNNNSNTNRKYVKRENNNNNNNNYNHTNGNGNRRNNNKANKAFLKWCQTTLGIQTLLEIRDFEYVNYYNEWKYNLKERQKEYYNFDFDFASDYDYEDNTNGGDNEMDMNNDNYDENITNNAADGDGTTSGPTKLSVRGLVATRDIEINEILISVPYHALITIQTTIDHDPVLSQVLGPKQRLKYGWTLSSSFAESDDGDGDANDNDDGEGSGDDNDKYEDDHNRGTMTASPPTGSISDEGGANGRDKKEGGGGGGDDGERNDAGDYIESSSSSSSPPLSTETSDSATALPSFDSSESSLPNKNGESSSNMSNRFNTKRNKNTIQSNKNNNHHHSHHDSSYYEIGLLTVALLYHRSLGELSPIWFQIYTLLDDSVSGIEYMPIRWDMHKLQHEFDGVTLGPSGDEVRRLVLSMKHDIKVMYNDIMGVLIRDHGDIFGRPTSASDNSTGSASLKSGNEEEEITIGDVDNDDDIGGDTEWMFSYEKFEWAFAIVNSRKWHLPLADLDESVGGSRIYGRNHASNYNENNSNSNGNRNTNGKNHHNDQIPVAANAMPAQQPTDEYMTLQDEAIRLEYSEENITPRPAPSPSLEHEQIRNKMKDDVIIRTKHSFMAPLADMLNFGPPCAEGRYNTEAKAFEVIATCKFFQGQEVTFWYSDDCDNVMIANYGFTHPMIPQCLSVEDWQYRSDVWKKYALSLEKSLDQIYEELYDTLQELEGCNCNDNNDDTQNEESVQDSSEQHSTVVPTDANVKRKRNDNDIDPHMEEDGHSGIRRIRQHEHEHEHDDVGL